ncbi:hypothetical protein KM043_015782 [Ampulex compressa]|nr:hypothetical protein KM043_015782 [Ampulex compressa]
MRIRRVKGDEAIEEGRFDAVTRQVASFTINDVEDSLAHFNGDDKLSIDHWINDFENTSELLEWNELQKFIYSKRMLRGSARQFITFEKEVKT